MFEIPWPVILLLWPFVAAVLLMIPVCREDKVIRFAFAATLTGAGLFVMTYLQWLHCDAAVLQCSILVPLAGYRMAFLVDATNIYLLALTAGLYPLAVLSAGNSITGRQREFHVWLMLSLGLVYGTFLARHLLVFYLFWESSLIPLFFIIGRWGGAARSRACFKFILMTSIGSILMLAAIISLLTTRGQLTPQVQYWSFIAFALAFLIKVPLVPFHTWLPEAHVEAPTPGSMILAGILLKLGAYGFVRFAGPLFPDAAAQFMPVLVSLAVLSIVWGSLAAWVQTDIKRIVAYSSVGHMGMIMLGVFAGNAEAFRGAMLAMVGHGLSSAGLFFLVGMLYERTHTRDIRAYSGLIAVIPNSSVFWVLVTLSAVAFPTTVGFAGEFLILSGTFKTGVAGFLAGSWGMLAAAGIAMSGVVLSAVYMFRVLQMMLMGQVKTPCALTDATLRERFVLWTFVLGIWVLGLYPAPVLSHLTGAARDYLRNFVHLNGGGNAE